MRLGREVCKQVHERGPPILQKILNLCGALQLTPPGRSEFLRKKWRVRRFGSGSLHQQASRRNIKLRLSTRPTPIGPGSDLGKQVLGRGPPLLQNFSVLCGAEQPLPLGRGEFLSCGGEGDDARGQALVP